MEAATSTTRERQQATGIEALQARFEALLADHKGIVFKVAGMYRRDADERRDLAQEICAQLWRAFPGYDVGRRFSTWMYRVALNVAIAHHRRDRLRDRHFFSLDDRAMAAIPESTSREPDDRIRELYRVIDRLHDLDRALILLYFEGHTNRESAEVLGITETNVATKLSRLRQRLRQELADSRGDQEKTHGHR